MQDKNTLVRNILHSVATMVVTARDHSQTTLVVNKEMLEYLDSNISALFLLDSRGITFENVDDLLNDIKFFSLP